MSLHSKLPAVVLLWTPSFLLFPLAACGADEPPPVAPSGDRAGAGVEAPEASPEPTAGPALVCAAPRVDLGEVFVGARLEHVFAVESAGDADALVVKLKPGCACSVAEAWTEGPEGDRTPYAEYDPIPPGRTLFVRARVDTTGKEGAQSIELTLYANVPDNKLVLVLDVRVQPWLRVEPGQLLLGRRRPEERRTAEAVVTGPPGERFALRSATVPLPEALAVTCEPLDPDAEGRAERWAVRLEHGPGGEPGLLRAWLELRSDRPHPAARELGEPSEPVEVGDVGAIGAPDPTHGVRLMAVGEVLAAVSASESLIAFGHVRRGVLLSRTVRIESHDPAFPLETEPPVRLLGSDGKEFFPEGRLRAVLRRVEGLQAWDVELSTEGLGEGFEGPFRGLLLVEVGHPEVFELEVPFSGVQL